VTKLSGCHISSSDNDIPEASVTKNKQFTELSQYVDLSCIIRVESVTTYNHTKPSASYSRLIKGRQRGCVHAKSNYTRPPFFMYLAVAMYDYFNQGVESTIGIFVFIVRL